MHVPFCAGCPCDALGMTELTACGPEEGGTAKYLVIGEAPGKDEIREGRPFVGMSGHLLQDAFQAVGIRRDECHLTHAIQCRPPENNIEAANIRVRRHNAKTGAGLKKPVAACRNRLLVEALLSGCTNVICLGKTAAQAIRGGTLSIRAIRGGCEEILAPWDGAPPIKVAYLLSPAFVAHAPQWSRVFTNDLRKAKLFFEGKLNWKDPEIVRTTDLVEIMATLDRFHTMGQPVAYDVETELKGAIDSMTRCIALANEDLALVVPIRSLRGLPLLGVPRHAGSQRTFSPGEKKALKPVLDFLENPPVPLVGHNAGQFDRTHMHQAWGCVPKLSLDTMGLHLLADNELPHNLGFVASYYTDNVESWKADHTATEAQSDEELHIYCAKDSAITARCVTPLLKEVAARNQTHLVQPEAMLMELGAVMTKNGMGLDMARAWTMEKNLTQAQQKHLGVAQTLLGDTDFNPMSHQQVQKLLFRDWKLAPHTYSPKTGDPSANDETLRRMLTHYGLSDERNKVISAIRRVRNTSKQLGTFVRPVTATRAKGGLVSDLTGRVHPSWNRLPATGRYSSSNPNAQNIPQDLRSMYVPKDGYVLVGADMDQLEYRVIAEEADAVNSIKWINSGLDPHNETMEIIYGKDVWKLAGAPKSRKKKGDQDFKATRDITKNVRYAWQYWAAPKRIWEQVVSVEDAAGNLIYAHLSLQDIRQVVNGLGNADPEIPLWWRKIEALFRRQGFIEDSLWGRRRYFQGEDNVNERVNHGIQSAGCVIVNEAMIELMYGPQKWFSTAATTPPGQTIPTSWLVNHGHDALYLEVPLANQKEAEDILEAAMTRRRLVAPQLTYTAGAKSADDWGKL